MVNAYRHKNINKVKHLKETTKQEYEIVVF